ncbi:MAG: hypothetical protein LBF27_14205 [Sphingobacterium sp.]|jgi:ribosome-associated toxin RatA of RatAB toxin-antitoxin module|nr:hypothetical protein [Sphingobacterium sp.]
MKFLITTSLLLFILTCTYAQKHTLDDISLSKSDFEIKEGITNHPYDAKIYTEVSYEYRIEEDKGKPILHVKAKLSINSDKSWIKEEFWSNASDKAKADLLAHEKGHLLVSLIHFKELENLWRQSIFSKQQCKLELRRAYKNIDSIGDSMNSAYDDETNHSRIREKQEEWITSLMNRINELYAEEEKISFSFQIKTPISE